MWTNENFTLGISGHVISDVAMSSGQMEMAKPPLNFFLVFFSFFFLFLKK
jgi:hypothetical protein